MSLKESLQGKKVLFFCIDFFNYEVHIKNKLESLGAHVKYYDERPNNSVLSKAIIRVKKSLVQSRIDAYYQNILKDPFTREADYLFVIRGEVVPTFFLDKLKVHNPNCTLLFYIWDSFENTPFPKRNLHLYDKIFSFEVADAERYGLVHRPLFYIDTFNKRNFSNEKKLKYDLMFIGTAHTDRYKIVSPLIKCVQNLGLSTYCYYFMHGRIIFLYKSLFMKGYHSVKYRELNFKSLSNIEVLDIIKQSKSMLDIQMPNQNGLTIRTFECLAAGKKLITTNKNIKNYRFYSSNNVYIIDRDDPQVPREFFESSNLEYDDDLLYRMSLEGWLADIFINEDIDDLRI